MSLEEFAKQLLIRKGRLSQADYAKLSGVGEKTIERLEKLAKYGTPTSHTGRRNAMDLAHAVGWDPDEALALLGHEPLTSYEREYLDTTAMQARFDRLWPKLTREQRRAVTNLLATMVFEYAPTADPRPSNAGSSHHGLVIAPDAEPPPLPGPRDNDGDDAVN